MLLHALTAAVGDLATGLLIVIAIAAFAAILIYLEARAERKLSEEEGGAEYIDPWAGLPPKWRAPEVESDLKSERRAM